MLAQSPIEAQGQRGLKKYKPWAYRRENTVTILRACMRPRMYDAPAARAPPTHIA